MKRIIALAFTVCLATSIGWAQVKVWKSPKNGQVIPTKQWEVNDLVFSVKKNVSNPFEVDAYAMVSGKGEEQKVPLFYNGGKEWVFRYSGSEVGELSFEIQSELNELNGKKGAFQVSKNENPDRHGGVVLNEQDPQHFYYEDGTHYFNLAFECDWLFALDYGQEKLAKTDHLLSLMDENGFNQVVMNVYSYDVKWPKDPLLAKHPEHEYGGREDIFPFMGSNSKPDFSSLNVDYFKHFDRVLSSMHDKDIVSHLMIYVWNKNVSWPDMDTPEDNRYYDYVVKRYQAFPNIIWDVSKEALFYGRATKEYVIERIDRTRKLDAFNRLVSVHDYGFCKNNPDHVDFISTQNWSFTLYDHMSAARNQFPDKPIFNIEHGGYEESPYVVFPGAYVNAETCLRRNYQCLFAGSYTTYYWQGAAWNVVIHNPYEQPDDFMKPKFEYFKHMSKLFKEVGFENFKPLKWNNSSGYNLTNEEDGVVMAYTPKESHWIGIGYSLKKNYDFSNATHQWFNTLTGEFTKEEKHKEFPTFYDERPWRGEADAIWIVRGLKKKPESE
ncbi:MAG: DUF5060 domain-containing protein [Bacteroidota bacterium]